MRNSVGRAAGAAKMASIRSYQLSVDMRVVVGIGRLRVVFVVVVAAAAAAAAAKDTQWQTGVLHPKHKGRARRQTSRRNSTRAPHCQL